MASAPLLVLGTGNRKKGQELFRLLAPLGLRIETLADYPTALAVEETGDTFGSNAALKATVQSRHLDRWVLGEDSGLAVDALDGRPGVYSARFAGPGATDEANNQRLLDELAGVPIERRAAHYVCHLALSDPTGHFRASCEAYCRGRIVDEPAGSAGFGYDPLFEIVEYHRTFGQLGGTVKAMLSHRSRAVEHFLPLAFQLLASRQWT